MNKEDWDKLKASADSGLNGLGAVVEGMHRMDEASGRLSRVMIVLSIVTVALTVIQAVAAGVSIWFIFRK